MLIRLMQLTALLVSVFVDEVTWFLSFVLFLRLAFTCLSVCLHATGTAHSLWHILLPRGRRASCILPPLSCVSCTPSAIAWASVWPGFEHSTVQEKDMLSHVMGNFYIGNMSAKPFPASISLLLLWLVGLYMLPLNTSLIMESFCRWFKTTKNFCTLKIFEIALHGKNSITQWYHVPISNINSHWITDVEIRRDICGNETSHYSMIGFS